jgi:hypothetical protein
VESARSCGTQVQRINCFYDRARTAIVGVEYTLRGSSQRRSICNTAAPSRETLYIRRGVGVGGLTVSSVSSWVVGLDFHLSDGKLASCRASTYHLASNSSSSGSDGQGSNWDDLIRVTVPRPNAAGGSGVGGLIAAESAAAAAAAPGAAAAVSIEDLMLNMPGTISNRPRCYPGCRPSECGSRCVQRAARRQITAPDARHVLGAISGVCMDSPGYFKDSLRELTRPCWVWAGELLHVLCQLL